MAGDVARGEAGHLESGALESHSLGALSPEVLHQLSDAATQHQLAPEHERVIEQIAREGVLHAQKQSSAELLRQSLLARSTEGPSSSLVLMHLHRAAEHGVSARDDHPTDTGRVPPAFRRPENLFSATGRRPAEPAAEVLRARFAQPDEPHTERLSFPNQPTTLSSGDMSARQRPLEALREPLEKEALDAKNVAHGDQPDPLPSARALEEKPASPVGEREENKSEELLERAQPEVHLPNHAQPEVHSPDLSNLTLTSSRELGWMPTDFLSQGPASAATRLSGDKPSRIASILAQEWKASLAAEVISALPPEKRAEVVRKIKREPVGEAFKRELWRSFPSQVKSNIADERRSSPRAMARWMEAGESPSQIAETLQGMVNTQKADLIRHKLEKQTRAEVLAAEVASGSLGPALPERPGMIARTVAELVKVGQDSAAYRVLDKAREEKPGNASRIIAKVEPWIAATLLQHKNVEEAQVLVKGLRESHLLRRELYVGRILEQLSPTMAEQIVPHIPGKIATRQAEHLAQTGEAARSLVALVRGPKDASVEILESGLSLLSYPHKEEIERIMGELKPLERVGVLRRIAETEEPSLFREVIVSALPIDMREATRLLMQENPRAGEKLSLLLPDHDDPTLSERARYFSGPLVTTKETIAIMKTILETDGKDEANRLRALLPLEIIKNVIAHSSPTEAKLLLQSTNRRQLAYLLAGYQRELIRSIARRRIATGSKILVSATLTSIIATGPTVALDGFQNITAMVFSSIVGDVAGAYVSYKLRDLPFPGIASTLGTTTWSVVTMALESAEKVF